MSEWILFRGAGFGDGSYKVSGSRDRMLRLSFRSLLSATAPQLRPSIKGIVTHVTPRRRTGSHALLPVGRSRTMTALPYSAAVRWALSQKRILLANLLQRSSSTFSCV